MKNLDKSVEFFLARREMNLKPIKIVYEDIFGNEYYFPYNTGGGEELAITLSTIFIRYKEKWYMLKTNNEVDFENEINMNELYDITGFEVLGIDVSKISIISENNKMFIHIDEGYKERFYKIFSEFLKLRSAYPNCPRVD